MIRPLFCVAHVRHHELDEPREPEDVDLELPSRLVDRHVLDRAVGPVAGVVDQDVDAALLVDHPLDAGDHRRVVGDVHGEGVHAAPLRARTSGRRGEPRRTPSKPARPAAAGRSPPRSRSTPRSPSATRASLIRTLDLLEPTADCLRHRPQPRAGDVGDGGVARRGRRSTPAAWARRS